MIENRCWNDTFQCLKNKYHAQRFLYSKIISFQNKGKIKTFNQQKLKEFISGKHALQEMLKEVLQAVENETSKNTRKSNYASKYKEHI